jgi:SAM-dependent methyltransferase
MSEYSPPTLPLCKLLESNAAIARKVLIIRSGPLNMVRDIIDTLQQVCPDAQITQFCHEGQQLDFCPNLIYNHPGYFRLDKTDTAALVGQKFDLTVIPYATDRRLHPEYHEVDKIANGSGTNKVVAVFWDHSALLLDEKLLALKEREVVMPYLKSKNSAIEEISQFTGETPETIEDRCHLAAARGDKLWSELQPSSDEEIERFYTATDFYIYALMKECDWRGARSDTVETIADELPAGARVLDYGAGCGAVGTAMARRGFRVTHLDLPGQLIEFARSRYEARKLPVTVLPAEQKYPLGSMYDAIICTHVLEHVPDPIDKLRHMAAHLAPGGTMFLAIPFEANPVGGEHPGMHLNRLTPTGYKALLGELGLNLVRRTGDMDILRSGG